MIRAAAVLLALTLAAAGAHAQFRTLPADAKRGTVQHVNGMLVAINGTMVQLAAGAQIRGADNLLIVPTAIPPGALAKYTLDAAGNVFRIWILSAQEAAQPDPPPQ